MAKNHSEKQTVILSKNSFLNMYVFSNPNKKCIENGECDEFCDCYIHIANQDIIIQIKQNDEPNSKNWFQRKILGKARLQLTAACIALGSQKFEIWDRNNKEMISKGNSNFQTIYPVIVFDKQNMHRYQQVALAEKPNETCPGYVYCNIFSMEDFEYATSMIPTSVDFLDYLIFRFNKLKKYESGIQLFPIIQTKVGLGHLKDVSSNEQILVAEFLYTKIDNPEHAIKHAKMWHQNISKLEKNKANRDFLQLLSYLSMESIDKWDECYKLLIAKSRGERYVWFPEPLLMGNVDEKKYGVMLSFLPLSLPFDFYSDMDDKIVKDAKKAIKIYKLDAIFIFQYTNSKIVKLSKVVI